MRRITVTLSKARAAWRRYQRRVRDPDATAGEYAGRLDRQLRRARIAWMKHMADFRNALGVVELPRDPVLTEAHLEQCRVLPDRRTLLQQMKRGGIAAEIGVETGEFSRAIMDICKPSRLHLIDLDLRRFEIATRFQAELTAGLIELHEGDSSPIIAGFPDRHFDFIYIDGDHSYYGVKRDIEAARTKVKDDGFLVFNDYTYWSPAESMRYGVIRAVNELCLEEDWMMIYFAFGPCMYCDVALQRWPAT